ncbi:hypothetical protein JCM8097_002296 [Rhodosporidiobolus ruineniae]
MLLSRLRLPLHARSALRTTRTRTFASTPTCLATLGLRAEDPARRWERRAAIAPKDVKTLLDDGHEVLVERSAKRVFRDQEYEEVGARLTDKLDPSTCDVVVGVKEPVLSSLSSSGSNSTSPRPTTHLAFFHCHKGQPYNFPLLRTLLSSPPSNRFIDYELLTDSPGGKRTTGFGKLAGYSGMADGLAQLGTKMLAQKGVASPFLGLTRPLQAATMEKMGAALLSAGEEVRRNGLGGAVGPLIITISGRGKVGDGARQACDELGVEWVQANELERLASDSDVPTSKIYACHLELGDYLVHQDGSAFDRKEYREHPERFTSVFHSKIAPYTTLFLNGGFWTPESPRLLTTAQLAELQQNPHNRLLSIVDVSCDFGGGLEFVKAATLLDDPIVQYDAATGELHRDASHPTSTQISSVEILPAALPLDASTSFSSSLLPYLRRLLNGSLPPAGTGAPNSLEGALERATLVKEGKLAEKHEWLYGLLEGEKVEKRQKAVLLGAGLVAGPALRTLAAKENLDIVVASNDLRAARDLSSGYSNVTAVELDAGDKEALTGLIRGADVVLSLLPAPMHVEVAKLCIQEKASLVTASYTSAQMAELDEQAKEAGVVLLNELGLDPGIDHITAMRLIEEARSTGGKIKSFVSFCGGLPSPEQSNAPLGYKFSWSPRGVLTAALNPATFRLNAREVSIPGPQLLKQHFPSVPILPGFAFEGVANRDSLKYLPEYGLDDGLETIMRGTLRYPGFARRVDAFKRIGLLGVDKLGEAVGSWDELVDACLREKGHEVDDEASRRTALLAVLDGDEGLVKDVLSTLDELALLPSSSAALNPSSSLPSLPASPQAPLDLLSLILAHQLRYNPGERDAVFLHHEVTTQTEAGEDELFTSTLVQYGTPEASAMATTVGVPIALGALLLLSPSSPLALAKRSGVVSPSSPEVWRPLLGELEKAGIKAVEGRKKGSRGMLEALEGAVAGW